MSAPEYFEPVEETAVKDNAYREPLDRFVLLVQTAAIAKAASGTVDPSQAAHRAVYAVYAAMSVQERDLPLQELAMAAVTFTEWMFGERPNAGLLWSKEDPTTPHWTLHRTIYREETPTL